MLLQRWSKMIRFKIEIVHVVSWISSSIEYNTGTQSKSFGIFMKITSSIYLNVKLNDLAYLIFGFLTSVGNNSDSYENKERFFYRNTDNFVKYIYLQIQQIFFSMKNLPSTDHSFLCITSVTFLFTKTKYAVRYHKLKDL